MGTTLSNATGLTRTGYYVANWQTSAGTFTATTGTSSAGTPHTLSATYHGQSNVTLYAVWKPITRTVRIYDGNTLKATVTASYGSPMPSISGVPSNPGYIFEGYWFKSGDVYLSQYYTSSLASAQNWNLTSASSYDLYAKW